jgi:ubiquinone/menaquinone biosynthesis C-methylase UbiE
MQTVAHDPTFWDRIARKYANEPIRDMAGYERTIDRTRQLLCITDNVLEIGCGTGTSALTLADGVASIVGTDASSEMIAIARQKAAARGCANAEFSVAPAESDAGIATGHDAVLAFNLLHLVADRAAVLRNVRDQLKQGGLFISKTPCLAEMNILIRLAVPVMRMVGRAPYVSFFSAPDLEGEITRAGFEVIERGRHDSGRRDARIFLVARKA